MTELLRFERWNRSALQKLHAFCARERFMSDMVSSAKPAHNERIFIIIMVRDYLLIPAHFARLRLEYPAFNRSGRDLPSFIFRMVFHFLCPLVAFSRQESQ